MGFSGVLGVLQGGVEGNFWGGTPPPPLLLHVGEGSRTPPPDGAACQGGVQTPPPPLLLWLQMYPPPWERRPPALTLKMTKLARRPRDALAAPALRRRRVAALYADGH